MSFSISLTAQSSNTIYEFGAKGDGQANDQEAIQKAVESCKKEKGATVLLTRVLSLQGNGHW